MEINFLTQTKSLRTPTNMFVVNLAVSDLIMMTTQGMPVTINAFTQRYWMWGNFGNTGRNSNSSLLLLLQDVQSMELLEQSVVLALS